MKATPALFARRSASACLRILALTGPVFCLLLILATTFAAKPTGITRISVGQDGSETDGLSRHFGLSKNGNLISFMSDATNLVPHDTNGVRDAFVYDRKKQVMTLVSVSSDGEPGNGPTLSAYMSDNGKWVTFHSEASNLVPGDTNEVADVFAHNLVTHETICASVSSDGVLANGASGWPAISKNGRYIAYRSSADNLVPDDHNEVGDVFVHDLKTHTTVRASLTESGEEPNGASLRHDISPNGRYIAVVSSATNVVAGDTNGFADIFIHDWRKHRTELVTVGWNGDQANGDSGQMKFSGNNRYLGFISWARNLVPDDSNEAQDVFVWSMKDGSIGRASVSSAGEESNGDSAGSGLSQDGKLVFFTSVATNLVANDTNGFHDLFVRDLKKGETRRITVTESGDQANADCRRPITTRKGRVVSFYTAADNIVRGDTNDVDDVFVIDNPR